MKILCIRPDNMGDLLMSGPAIRALKESFNAHITVLTSSMGAPVTASIPEIDDTIIFDAPWVKADNTDKTLDETIELLKSKAFDAAVIFTVYSQNPLPSVMLAYLAGIPVRLAYCRENPYHLLTHWIPDKEPYEFIRHQVRRDLDLVAHIGAYTTNENLNIVVQENLWEQVSEKLKIAGINPAKPIVILHTEVSEVKRQYPQADWISVAENLSDYQLVLTGKKHQYDLPGVKSLSGKLVLEELIVLIKHAALLISVNTGSVHIAAATKTPVVVLYALTNPQHTPWKTRNKVLYFDTPEELSSKNEVVRYVKKTMAAEPAATVENVISAATELLSCLQQPHSFI